MESHKKIDKNLLEGRKIYKNIWNKSFKKFSLIGLTSTSILSLICLAYYIINFNLTLIIIFSIILVVLPLLIFSITYPLFKHIYFPYKEIIYRKESFCCFASSDNIGGDYYTPCFHVVYKGKEYSVTRQSTYVGNDIVLASLETILNSKTKNLNFLEINICSETLGNIKCLFVLATKTFYICDNSNS